LFLIIVMLVDVEEVVRVKAMGDQQC